MNKNAVRHHPYSSQDYNRNLSPNYNRNYNRNTAKDHIEKDYQQDYDQDYHIPTIEKAANQLNQPNSIKLLISRGVQNNLLTANDYKYTNTSPTKKFPLEIPFNSYYGNNVSVLNLSKEKLIPLNQYTSDSSSTATSVSLNDKQIRHHNKKSIDLQKQQQMDKNSVGPDVRAREPRLEYRVDSRTDPRIDSKFDSRGDSRSESRSSEPKRLIKKEIIEEFETITTTTTFKNNSNRNSPNLSQVDDSKIKDAQLNEQTKSIINAIRDELKRFNQQPTHIQQFKK